MKFPCLVDMNLTAISMANISAEYIEECLGNLCCKLKSLLQTKQPASHPFTEPSLNTAVLSEYCV